MGEINKWTQSMVEINILSIKKGELNTISMCILFVSTIHRGAI